MDHTTHTEADLPSGNSPPEDVESASGITWSENDMEHTVADFASDLNTQSLQVPSRGGNFFPGAQNFTVAGGTFTNVTHNYNNGLTVLSDFRSIRLGDIDLRELRLERGRVHGRQSPSRVYAARVEGRNSDVTVAIYEGRGAKEDWREDIALYSSLRHPNFLQLWGITSSSGIHAAIFHDDLIPFRHFLELHQPVLVVYIYAYVAREYWVKEPDHASNRIDARAGVAKVVPIGL
ncbi:hypothetical protein C8R47DRAFT_5544 [Mycena vitilis]|nr:hypothetical protein C8R47DRAFT_5544 [Mycena vitilis]